MKDTITVYMFCEPEFLLPIDFDTSLKDLCTRNAINYGYARNTLLRTFSLNGSRKTWKNGYLLERVTFSEKV